MDLDTEQMPGLEPGTLETNFDPVQLNLPCVSSAETTCAEWQVPCKVLADYLRATGVHQPGETARGLIDEFGSLSGLLAASRWRLRRIAGPRLADVIHASRSLMKARLLEKVEEGPLVPRTPELIDLLQIKVGFLDYERMMALYVDSLGRLIQIVDIADGSRASVYPSSRKIIQHGLELGASGFILVHNHPSGIPRPSTGDLACTSKLRALAADLEIPLLDHLIIARGQFGSIEDYWRQAQWNG